MPSLAVGRLRPDVTESRHESEPAWQIPTQEGLTSWLTWLGAEGPGIDSDRSQSRRDLRWRMRKERQAASPSHGPEPVEEELRHGHARPWTELQCEED